MIFAVLASGPSMSLQLARSLMGRCAVVSVSDCYKLAPWADAFCATDFAWWQQHPEAIALPGPKWSAAPDYKPVEGVKRFPESLPGINSGLLGIKVAVSMGAKTVLLCGFDMKGSHFFGPHPAPLKNTAPHRFVAFQEQFARYKPKDVRIINCTKTSSLLCYPRSTLEVELACLSRTTLPLKDISSVMTAGSMA